MNWWNIFDSSKDMISMPQWIIRIGKIFGFLPFTIVHNKKMQRIYLAPWDCCWMLSSIMIYGLCIYVVYCEDSKNLPYSMLQVLIVKMATMSGGAVAIFGILMDFLNRHQIWFMIRTFNEFDCQVGIQNTRIEHKILNVCIFFICVSDESPWQPLRFCSAEKKFASRHFIYVGIDHYGCSVHGWIPQYCSKRQCELCVIVHCIFNHDRKSFDHDVLVHVFLVECSATVSANQ